MNNTTEKMLKAINSLQEAFHEAGISDVHISITTNATNEQIKEMDAMLNLVDYNAIMEANRLKLLEIRNKPDRYCITQFI